MPDLINASYVLIKHAIYWILLLCPSGYTSTTDLTCSTCKIAPLSIPYISEAEGGNAASSMSVDN